MNASQYRGAAGEAIGHIAVYDPQIVHKLSTATAEALRTASSPSKGQTDAQAFAAAQWAAAFETV